MSKVQAGETFGKLVTIERVGSNKHRRPIWKCQCECGNTTEVVSRELRSGDTRSCGCIRLNTGHDKTGMIIGSLTVVAKVHNNRRKKWLCSCNCGKQIRLGSKDLDGIRYNSCGCRAGLPRISNRTRIINGRYKTYRQNAKRKGREFALTLDEFTSLVTQPCYYCGGTDLRDYRRGPCRISGFRKAELVNGVDRIDSTQGYSLANSVPACYMCNKMKMEFGLADWLKQITKIYERHVKPNEI